MSQRPAAAPPAELALLESAVAENPGSRLFLRLGRAYLQAGRLGQAAQTLRQGLALQPWEVEGHQLLAEAQERQGDQAGALAQLAEASALLGRQAGLYQALAKLLMAQGRDHEAMVAQRLARDLQTDFAAAAPPAPAAEPEQAGQDTPTLAEIYAAQGLTGQAIEIYRRLLAQEPENQGYLLRLAQLEDPLLKSPGPAQQILASLQALRRAALDRLGGGAPDQEVLERLESLRSSALARAGQA